MNKVKLFKKYELIFFILFLNAVCYSQNPANNRDNDSLKIDNQGIDIFTGIGFAPFELNLGFGYFITEGIDLNVQYSSLFMPAAYDLSFLSIGMKLYEVNSPVIHSIILGAVFQRKDFSLDGFGLEGSLGYIVQTDIGFYFLPGFKIGGVVLESERSGWITGIDLQIGWIIK